MIRLASVIALLVLARAEPAAADCGGSGGGGSGGSGGGGGGGGGDGGSSTPACHETSDVVGYRECTRFGTWGNSARMPRAFFEIGAAMRTFTSPTGERTGHVRHDTEEFSYRVVGGESGTAAQDAAMVWRLRLGVSGAHGLYAALDGELGGLVEEHGRVEMTSSGMFGQPQIEQRSAFVTSALGVAGIGGTVGGTALGVEVAGGVRNVSNAYDSRYLACVQTEHVSVASPVLEARASASLWLAPFVNVGATAGASVIDRGAWMAGVHLGFAAKAYGGTRR